MEEEQEMNTREQELKSKLEGVVAHKVRKPEHGVVTKGFSNIIYTSVDWAKGVCAT